MTGSTAVAIVTPIVALITLAFWLSLLFYVGSHPFWRGQRQASREQLAGPGQPGTGPPPPTQGLPDAASPATASPAAASSATASPAAAAASPQREAHG